MGIFGVLTLLQNYKFILWGCSAIKLSAEYCPPRENLLPFISVCVCVFAQPRGLVMTFTLGIIATLRAADWQTLIARFFSFFCDSQLLRDHCALLILRSSFVDADAFEQAKCMAHILTPYFHHLAPETRFLSGQVPGLTPFMGVKPPVMDAHYIKSVCVCVCMVSQM